MIPLFDLHMDLLSYLASSESTSPYDETPHCSLRQLRAGGVKLQILPVFTKTGTGSEVVGAKQVIWYEKLLEGYAEDVASLNSLTSLSHMPDKLVIAPAIENCSSFAAEEEHLDIILARIGHAISRVGTFIYAGLTWVGDNRFGGGNDSEKALTDNGKVLIEFFNSQKIPVDVSHAGENLVQGIFKYADSVISSHSNARAKKDMQRNLSDEVIKELISRKALLGVNGCRRQHASNSLDAWADNVEHIMELEADNLLCFGTDFYFDGDSVEPGESAFFSECSDASKMQILFKTLKERHFSQDKLKKICSGNIERYLTTRFDFKKT